MVCEIKIISKLNGSFKRIGLHVVLWLGCWWVMQPALAASFDCAKARTKIEKLICADVGLSKLDEELSATYKTALKDVKQADFIKQSQKLWMKERNECSDVACVKRAYEERIKKLSQSKQKLAGNHSQNNGSGGRSVRTESYSLVMSKDDDLCNHMLNEFNEDLQQFGSDGSDFHERHGEFTSIPWVKARYSNEYHGRIEYTDVEGAIFDFNNDGVPDYVVHEISSLSGMRAEEIFILDAKEEKNTNGMSFKEINGSKNKIRIAGSSGYSLSAPFDGQRSDGWVLAPFKYNDTYYLFMRSVAVGFMSDISVIAKYNGGRFVHRDMTGKMQDICYYKYNGTTRIINER